MQATAEELERLADSHELTVLTSEEEELIYSFRVFKEKKHKPGAIFRWQTRPEKEGGNLPSRIIQPGPSRLITTVTDHFARR